MPRLNLLLLRQKRLTIHLEMSLRMEGMTLQAGGVFGTVALGAALLTSDVDVLWGLRLRGIMTTTTLIDIVRIVVEFGLGEPMGRNLRLHNPPG